MPAGYRAYDLSTGKSVSEITLDSRGKAGVEVKTGNGDLERYQPDLYNACISGNGCAIGVGGNARDAGVSGSEVPGNIYILRPIGG